MHIVKGEQEGFTHGHALGDVEVGHLAVALGIELDLLAFVAVVIFRRQGQNAATFQIQPVFLLFAAVDQLSQGVEVERESAHGFSPCF